MKNIWFLICCGFFTLSNAAMPHFLHYMPPSKNASQKHFSDEEGYTDFSGEWYGSCDNSPNDFETMRIQNSDSVFTVDGFSMSIDGITTFQQALKMEIASTALHLRWDVEGQQLLGTMVHYDKIGNLSVDGMNIFVETLIWSRENEELVLKLTQSFFNNGKHDFDTHVVCRYKPKKAS